MTLFNIQHTQVTRNFLVVESVGSKPLKTKTKFQHIFQREAVSSLLFNNNVILGGWIEYVYEIISLLPSIVMK